ncbi:hypothetical protein H8E77_00770 [bacterium]|nr:hypothetical protein [bacterium]
MSTEKRCRVKPTTKTRFLRENGFFETYHGLEKSVSSLVITSISVGFPKHIRWKTK